MARTTYKFPIIHGRRRASWTVESLKERKAQPKVEKSLVTFSRREIDVKWLCHQHSVSNTSIKLPCRKWRIRQKRQPIKIRAETTKEMEPDWIRFNP